MNIKPINKFHRDNIAYIRSSFAGIYLACLIAFACFPKTIHTSKASDVIPDSIITPTATPTPISWNDAIRKVFPKDEAGRMIRICIAENKSQDKTAINYNTNGTYDYGWCQINSCHKPDDMTDIEWKLYLENPDNHAKEARRVFLSQWWYAWSTYKFGLVK